MPDRLNWIPQILRSRGLARNGLFALGQSVVLLLCMFLSFRILVEQCGIEGLGLWSLLMIFGGLTATFDVSGAAALSRTVARHQIEFYDVPQAEVVHTVLLTSLAINALFSAILLALAHYLLPQMIDVEQLREASRLLPFVAVLMISMPLATGVAATMDGMMRADLRAMLLAVAAICSLAVAWFAIPLFGIKGFAIAQLVQQGLVIIGGWLWLRRAIGGLGWWPSRWSGSVFRRTTGYAVKLNIIGATGLLLEPLTKYCVNLAGGVVAVGSYELAARLITQLRGLVVGAAIPAIPVFASESRHDKRFTSILTRAKLHAAFAAVAVALLSILGAPIMCWLILGEGNSDMLRMNAMLAFGWSINLLSLPFYLAAQGQGALRWNIVSHVLNGAGAVLGFFLLNHILGQISVVAGVAVGLVLGAIVTIWGNSRMFAMQSAPHQLRYLTMAVVAANAAMCALGWLAAEPVTLLIREVTHG